MNDVNQDGERKRFNELEKEVSRAEGIFFGSTLISTLAGLTLATTCESLPKEDLDRFALSFLGLALITYTSFWYSLGKYTPEYKRLAKKYKTYMCL